MENIIYNRYSYGVDMETFVYHTPRDPTAGFIYTLLQNGSPQAEETPV